MSSAKPSPMGVGEQADPQPTVSKRAQRRPGVGVVADVRRPRVEVVGRRLLEQRFGGVETEATRGGRQQLGERAAPLMGGRGGPELLLYRHQDLGHLVLAVGRQMAGDHAPGVDQLGLHEDREGAAPVEDHGVDSHAAIPPHGPPGSGFCGRRPTP
ncbi:MAG: hypothetical protein E6G57_12835 [Actinobacteria bacterium]|nr:MAG: hypothetical protein E6G57_12835 [Actinomycetota bacterium]